MTLDREDVEAVALRVVELLDERSVVPRAPVASLVDARVVADRLGVSRDFVYAHRVELGGRPIGDGPRPRWRYDLEHAASCFGIRGSETSKPARLQGSARKRRRSSGTGVDLLPVRGANRV